MSSKKERIVLTVSFVLFLLINGFFVVIHEPWRDEIHAWLMAKYMSVPEMISFCPYEGHPLLWHLILLPFARAGAPVWTMHIISYICVAVSAFLFLYKTGLNTVVKIIVLFTIPFVYTYSSIARNYCLVLLIVMAICVMYDKRYENPVIYSLLISLLVFTHGLAWGFVAGATITLHIYELVLKCLGKSKLDKKSFTALMAGLVMIAASTVTVLVTIYGEQTVGYYSQSDQYADMQIIAMAATMVLSIAYTAVCKGKTWKEAVIFCLAVLFISVIYKMSYASVIPQKSILTQVYLLFFLVCAYRKESKMSPGNVFAVALFFISFILNGSIINTVYCYTSDISQNYSSGKEMAEYINDNLKDEDVILVDSGICAQTLVPYTDKELYDVRFQGSVTDNVGYYYTADEEKDIQSIRTIPDHEEYKGKYIVMFYNFDNLPFEEVYRTSESIMGEDFTLYYIPE
ncbi:MAG: hypothetical protein J6Z43_04580 [Clostridiales bacterium]|nr:hypothetical protein [Clostridiales bacterium]